MEENLGDFTQNSAEETATKVVREGLWLEVEAAKQRSGEALQAGWKGLGAVEISIVMN